MMTAAATEAPWITVNGAAITAKQIGAEVQYHPAGSLSEAREKAMQALVVRELLLQEAQNKGIFKDRCAVKDEQAAIDALLEDEVKVPEPDRESCERYYKNNRQRFVTSNLFDVSHILFAAPPEDEAARSSAKQKAAAVLSQMEGNPDCFPEMARQHSSCSSAKDGGRLGQISKGQTTPDFEAALFGMHKGETSREPVATRYGYHILRVHERAESKELPFEAVQQWIADYLKQSAWQRAVSQYIGLLAGKAEIKGFKLKSYETALVQ
ncbi:MAG: peptidylprolyl isomerase [Alphaproteobacteria bacterium]|nr:peptidylprolyl isomerase [Alphaproteobacteria bacterium]